MHVEADSIESDSPTKNMVVYLLDRKDDARMQASHSMYPHDSLCIAQARPKFTRANRPVSILGVQPFATKSAALKAEHSLKQLEKPAKLDWARLNPAQE